jgi:hypothetical protein
MVLGAVPNFSDLPPHRAERAQAPLARSQAVTRLAIIPVFGPEPKRLRFPLRCRNR